MKSPISTALSVLLLAALLFVAVSAPFALTGAIRHDCAGKHCPVCGLILGCVSACVHLTRAAVLLAFAGSCVFCLILRMRTELSGRNGADPVGRGIRLLN